MTLPELAVDLAPASDDDRLLQAEAQVRGYCRWHIAPSRTETVTVWPNADGTLHLPSLYVTDVASVTDSGTLVDLADYRFTEAGVISRVGYWFWDSASLGVEVTFTHGYTDPPADVTAIVQAFAARAIGNGAGLKSKAVGPFAETYSTDLLSQEKATLAQYRIPAAF